MSFCVGLDPSQVGEGSEARTIHWTSVLLPSDGLPLACFVLAASLIVSLMLLAMQNCVEDETIPALADVGQTSVSETAALKSMPVVVVRGFLLELHL